MAKLSAHGTEIFRIEKDFPLTDCVCIQFQALMSDGVILAKNTYRRADGTTHCDGWKKQMRTRMLPERWLEMKQNHGWKRSC